MRLGNVKESSLFGLFFSPSFFRLGLASTSYCLIIEVEEKARRTTPSLALPLRVPNGKKKYPMVKYQIEVLMVGLLEDPSLAGKPSSSL